VWLSRSLAQRKVAEACKAKPTASSLPLVDTSADHPAATEHEKANAKRLKTPLSHASPQRPHGGDAASSGASPPGSSGTNRRHAVAHAKGSNGTIILTFLLF
jgi:hypothetical protein